MPDPALVLRSPFPTVGHGGHWKKAWVTQVVSKDGWTALLGFGVPIFLEGTPYGAQQTPYKNALVPAVGCWARPGLGPALL